jgi:hypothetical protein
LSDDITYLKQVDEGIEQLTFATLKLAENLVHINKRYVAAPDWPYVKEDVLEALNLDEDDYQDIQEDSETSLEN